MLHFRLKSTECSAHPFLRLAGDSQSYDILNKLANYKSHTVGLPITVIIVFIQTIFEQNFGSKSQAALIMKQKRRAHENKIVETTEQKVCQNFVKVPFL